MHVGTSIPPLYALLARARSARAAVGALLNAENLGSGEGGYTMSVQQVIGSVNGAFNPGDRDNMISLAEELDNYNNQ